MQSSDDIDFMQQLVGISYSDGGLSPKDGFDCWGLVRWCVKTLDGIELPEKPLAWRRYGYLIGKDAKIERGDILFFLADPPNQIHMGIATSKTEFIHAWKHAGQVVCEPIDRRRSLLLNVGRITDNDNHDFRD